MMIDLIENTIDKAKMNDESISISLSKYWCDDRYHIRHHC